MTNNAQRSLVKPDVREQQWSNAMRAALDGDAMAYRALLDEIAAVCRTAARRHLARAGQGGADAEDIVQETLLAIHLKRQTWDRQAPLGPWIAAILRNKAVDAMRRNGRRAHAPLDDLHDVLAAPPTVDPTEATDVNRMLDGLEPRQRDIVASISRDGHTVAATAMRLGMSEGAVRVALHRALKALALIYRRSIA
jgi:RNA polymerase sigma factor (sigma-70 family)